MHDASRMHAAGVGFAVLIGLLVSVAGQLEPYGWVLRDGRFYVNSTVSLLENGSYEEIFARSWYEADLGWNRNLPASFSNVALGTRGELYHFRPWIMPLLATPFFYAFWLWGILAFNLLVYLAIAVLGYRLAVHFASRRAAASAVAVGIVGSGMIETVYDFSIDALMTASFLGGCVALLKKRSVLGGALVAAALAIKPTAILFVPAAAALLLLHSEHRGKRLLHAIGGGAIALGIFGGVNWYMYGAPWIDGHMRAVHLVAGEMQLASTGDAFNTPLMEGLRRTLGGGYGIGKFYAVYALALVGYLRVVRRHPAFGLLAIAGTIAGLLLFSLFDFESDRFHYLAFASAFPALACGAQMTVAFLARVIPRSSRVPLYAALLAAMVSLAGVARGGRDHPWRTDLPMAALRDAVDVPAHRAAVDLVAETGALDLRGHVGEDRLSGADSPISRGRFGQWLPRENLLVAITTGAARRLHLEPVLNAALGALAFYAFLVAFAGLAPSSIALALAVALCCVHPIREALTLGGAPLLAMLAVALALAWTRQSRFAAATGAAIAAAWILGSAWSPFPLGVVVAAWAMQSEPPRPALATALVGYAAWAGFDLLVYGRAFSGPDDFVLVAASGGLDVFHVHAEALHLGAIFRRATPERMAFVALAIGMAGLIPTMLHSRATSLRAPLGALAIAAVVPATWRASAPGPFLVAPLALAAMGWLGPAARAMRLPSGPRQWTGSFAVVALLLLAIGAAWRIPMARADFDLTSLREIRHAKVFLDDYPCDFLTWETMTWECASYDGDTAGRTGWMTPGRVHVQGERLPLFVIPTGRHGRRTRRVVFDIPEHLHGRTLTLTFAVPDEYTGAAMLEVWSGERLASFEASGALRTEEITLPAPGDTPRSLELRVVPREPGLTAIAVEGSLGD